MRKRGGFTLIEALLAIATLALLAAATAVLYGSGLKSLDVQADEILLCSLLRSGMEDAVATPFDTLAGSSTNLTVGTRSLTRSRAVAPVDMDGDGTAETNAVRITVTLDGRSLSLLRVDDQDRLAKH